MLPRRWLCIASVCAATAALPEPQGRHTWDARDPSAFEGAIFTAFYRQQTGHFALEDGPAVVRWLPLLPDARVVDIGAGIGLYAAACAEALRAVGGTVVATDVNPQVVEFINGEARRRGLRNLRAVVVDGRGFDPFYQKHRFDLVLMFNVVNQLPRREEFLASLGRRMAPGGRLILLNGVRTPWTPERVADSSGLVRDLASAPASDPLASRLSPSTRLALRAALRERRPPTALMAQVMREIEDMTHDMGFALGFLGPGRKLDPGLRLDSKERAAAEWFLLRVRRVLEEGQASQDEDGKRNMHSFNSLLIARRLKPYLAAGMNRPGSEMNEVREQLTRSGWRFVRETPWGYSEVLWELSRKGAKKKGRRRDGGG